MRSILLSLLLCSSALGQDVIVGPDNIKVGTALTCPRFSTLYPADRVQIVPAETTFTLPPVLDKDVYEVSGVLKLSRDYDTSGKFIVIQVLPGGSLDFGSASDPVLRKVDLQIKDSPLLTGTDGNLGPDPEQFGSGILVFGEWKSYGRALNKTWTTMQPVAAGATTLTLTDAVNWQAGDELLIPDSRQPYLNGYDTPENQRPIRRESKVSIAAINGNAITISKPLDFEHDAFRRPDGSIVGLPYIANCTRNIVIRSENPNGTRGHTMFMGNAHVDVRYTSFLGMGRTTGALIDNFNPNSLHVGMNQIARYIFHWHHVHGHADAQNLAGKCIGNFFDGMDLTKWGIVQHQTPDLFVADNVVDRCTGSGVVTEDGNEVREQNYRNFVTYCKGNGKGFVENSDPTSLAPGAEGAGFWYHGSGWNRVDDNVSLCNVIGFLLGNMHQVGNRIPGNPGEPNNTDYDPATGFPASCARNVAACSLQSGCEYWRMPKFPNVDLKVLHNNGRYASSVVAGSGQGGSVYLVNPTLVKSLLPNDYENEGVASARAYTGQLLIEGGEIRGHAIGVHDARWNEPQVRVVNTVLQNQVNVVWGFDLPFDLTTYELDGVLCEDLPGYPRKWIQLEAAGPAYGFASDNDGYRMKLSNWQRTGKNYFLFFNEQAGDAPVQVGPEPLLTNSQSWAKYGIALDGAVAPDGSIRMGGVDGLMWEGDAVPMGPPKAVFLNLSNYFGKSVPAFILTGSERQLDGQTKYLMQVDSGPPTQITLAGNGRTDNAWVDTDISAGPHVIKTWTTNLVGVKNVGSDLTFSICGGTPPPPTNNPPVVSAITPTPADVDPSTPGVQEYLGPVAYAFTASDPDGDQMTIKVFVEINGGARQQYNGPVTPAGWTFNYTQPVNYVWTVQADDGKGGVTESSLAVQVLNPPVTPPATANVRVTLPDGSIYEGTIPRQP